MFQPPIINSILRMGKLRHRKANTVCVSWQGWDFNTGSVAPESMILTSGLSTLPSVLWTHRAPSKPRPQATPNTGPPASCFLSQAPKYNASHWMCLSP